MTGDLKREMIAKLTEFADGMYDPEGLEFEFDVEGAIYWFCNDWHEGGGSDRYSILSTSPYKPAPSHSCAEDESELCGEMYHELVRLYECGGEVAWNSPFRESRPIRLT